VITYQNLLSSVAAYCLTNKGVWLHVTNAQISRCMRPSGVEAWAKKNNLECVARTTDTHDGYKFRSV
jgi:hypothetical protein